MKKYLKKLLKILIVIFICTLLINPSKSFSFDNNLQSKPSYWEESDWDKQVSTYGDNLVLYLTSESYGSALVNNMATDANKWKSTDGWVSTSAECILWINQYVHSNKVDYKYLVDELNDNIIKLITESLEKYFSKSNIDAINKTVNDGHDEKSKTSIYDTDGANGIGIDEMEYLYFSTIAKNINEVAKESRETIQELHATAAYAKSKGIDTKLPTSYTASDGKKVSLLDDYDTKKNYTKEQIEKYLEEYGNRYGVTERSQLMVQWASKINGNGKWITDASEAEKILIDKNNEYINNWITKTTGYTQEELKKQSEDNSKKLNNKNTDLYEDGLYNIPNRTNTTTTGGKNLDDVIEGADNFLTVGKDEKINREGLQDFSSSLYNILLTAGIIVAVIIGLIIGIKFMIGSVEAKAEVKKLLVPYIVGCVVVFGAFGIWKIVVVILGQL